MSPERVSVGDEGEGHSVKTDGPKAEKARGTTAESLVRGIWKMRISEAERRVREGV